MRVVGEKGYGGASVADVIAASDTSRSDFYKHFEDKRECFLAAYDMIAERVMGEVVAGCDGRQPWPARMERGLATIVELFAVDPCLARTAVVEVVAAGAEARRRHCEALTRLADFLEDGRGLDGNRELPDSTATMAAGAVSGLISDELGASGAESLPGLFPDLLFAMLVPYLGPQAAAVEMRRAAAGRGPG